MKHILLTLCLIASFSPWTLAQQEQFTWKFAGPPGSADRILALAGDPHYDSVIYAATPGGGVWKTLDAGNTWAPIFDSQASLQVCSVAVDPLSSDVVYAGTGDDQSPLPSQGVSRSADGGKTWTALPRITNQAVCALGIDPLNTAHILAGSAEGLFISGDSGSTWSKVLNSPVTSIAFAGPNVVYAGLLGDDVPGVRTHILSRSYDGGRTWADVALPRNPSTPDAATTWVTVRTAGNSVYVAVASTSTPLAQLDFFGSSDGGNQWSPAFAIGTAHPPMALMVYQNTNLYLAGTNLQSSSDSGITWTVIPTQTTELHSLVPSLEGLILAGEKGLESITLTGVPRGISQMPLAQIIGVDIDSAGDSWAGGPSGLFELFPSLDFLKTSVGAAGRVGVVEATTGTTTIVTASTTQVYASTDGGTHFIARTAIAEGEPHVAYPPVVLDQVNPSSAFVAGRRVYHTSNSGNTWTAMRIVDPDLTRVVIALAMAPAARTTLFAATACLPEVTHTACPAISVIWRSANAGQAWTQMSIVNGFVSQFAIDPRQSNRVYAAIGAFPGGPSVAAGLIPGDLLLSTNSGAAWSSVLGNLPRTTINTVLIDPESLPAQFTLPALVMYVGTAAGVFVNFDASANTPQWVDISHGLPATPITDLALLQPDGILVAGTFGRGVYKASVAGLAADLLVSPLSLELTLMRGTAVNTGLGLTNPSNRSSVDWQLNTPEAWMTLLQPGDRLRPLTSAQVPVRVSAADLQAGTYIGHLQVDSPFVEQTVDVQLHVTPAAFQMTIAGGDGAAGLGGATLPPLQVLVLDENRAPLSGAAVTFMIVSGTGRLSARTAVTNDSGLASVVLTLPKDPGTVQVLAASGTTSVVFTATVIAAPALLTDSIFDAVTFNANASFGPGSILLIVGQNLATSDAAATESLPSMLSSTRVLLTTPAGDVPLPLFSVSSSQITALLPLDTGPGTYLLHIDVGSIQSNAVEISVAAFSPGIFTLNGNGRGAGVFVKTDGSIVTASNPADRGATVTFYATGLGAVRPPAGSGEPGATVEPLNRTVQTPRVFFDRYAASLVYSGLAPGIAGRYQVSVQVPTLLSPATNISVSLTIGGYTSNRVTIPVR